MIKDKRYFALKTYMESGKIKSFSEIFDIVPKSTIVKDSGISYVRLNKKIFHPEKFTLKDLTSIARAIGVDSIKLFELVCK